jgi:hypothetical protein
MGREFNDYVNGKVREIVELEISLLSCIFVMGRLIVMNAELSYLQEASNP